MVRGTRSLQKRVGTTVWLCLASAGCRIRCTVKVFAGTARRPGLARPLRVAGCTIEILGLVAHGLCGTRARQDGRFPKQVFVALACTMRRANSHIQLEPAEVFLVRILRRPLPAPRGSPPARSTATSNPAAAPDLNSADWPARGAPLVAPSSWTRTLKRTRVAKTW